jgi:N4-gp56 family major capsid protein
MGMEDWWAERLDTALANQLTGNTDESDLKKTGLNATVAPTSANSVTRIIVGGGEGSEASLSATTTHAIKLSDLDRAVAYAKVQTPRIRQIRVDGSERFVTFLHPYAIYQMRRDASTAGNFFDVQKAMLQGGKISDNPIVTGASFVYNNVIVHEWAYLPDVAAAVSSSASYRRGVFCGAQAAVLAVGMKDSPTKMRWVEEYFDYEEQLGVAVGMVHGIKKTQFNSVDFGTIVLSGYAPAP